MKRHHVCVATTALVAATALAIAGVLGESASASISARGVSTVGAGVVRGTIGHAAPSPNAAARIRALGLEDDGVGSDDGGGLLPGGRVAHGAIGSVAPSAHAAAGIRALGLDD